ncbi:hypothetical protein NX059_008948 [Plenodomus lindquistii]|nr:hypothetical protein NX059_008948 [Plenodomus lindquistii]
MVTVKIGADQKHYHVHQALAMHYSDYFRCALESKRFEEGKTGIVTLTDIETYTFEAFAYWLYRQALPKVEDWEEEFEAIYNTERAMIELYIFANRFLVPELMDIMSRLLFDSCKNSYISAEGINIAFEHLHCDDPMLRLLVDAYVLSWNPALDEYEGQDDLQRLPIAFFRRVTRRFVDLRDKGFTKLSYADYAAVKAKTVGDKSEPQRKKIRITV